MLILTHPMFLYPAVIIFFLLSTQCSIASKSVKTYGYAQVIHELHKQKKFCFDFVNFHNITLGSILKKKNGAPYETPKCGSQKCVYPLVFKPGSESTDPVMVLAAGFTGKDRVGTSTLVNLIKFICSSKKRKSLQALLEKVNLYIFPMINAWEYYHKKKSENISRSFDSAHNRTNEPYLRYLASELLYRAFSNKPVNLMILFETGENMIYYPWTNQLSPEVPPNETYGETNKYTSEHIMRVLSPLIQSAGGTLSSFESRNKSDLTLLNTADINWYFNTSPIISSLNFSTNVLEKFGYHDPDIESITTTLTCQTPKASLHLTNKTTNSPYIFVFSNDKGSVAEFNRPFEEIEKEVFHPSRSDGPISRNIRMILKGLELMRPNLLSLHPSIIGRVTKKGIVLEGDLLPVGCLRIEKLSLIGRNENGSEIRIPIVSQPRECQAINMWDSIYHSTEKSYWPENLGGFHNSKPVLIRHLVPSDYTSQIIVEFVVHGYLSKRNNLALSTEENQQCPLKHQSLMMWTPLLTNLQYNCPNKFIIYRILSPLEGSAESFKFVEKLKKHFSRENNLEP